MAGLFPLHGRIQLDIPIRTTATTATNDPFHFTHTSDMQEAEEQDTCRICSAPAEQDQPLFYPCKCSGTIRYIHQDCLTTWLAHSKKKHCDVCKHPYSFTKVYAPDMPKRLPPVLLIRQLVQQCLFALLLGIRAITVALIWLAVLPWVTVWTWRMYFSAGDSAAWWISDRPHPPSTSPTLRDFLLSVITTSSSSASSDSFFVRLTSHPSWVALSSDIFKGQVIATLIVLTFVAMFLLREWISQNARPGIFEDDDLLEERERPVAQLQPQQQVQQQVHPPAEPTPTIPAIPPRMPLIDDSAETQQNVDGPSYLALDNHPIGDQPVDERGQIRRIVRRRPFAPQRNTGTGSTAQEDVSQSGLRVPARSRRRFGSGARTDGNITGDAQDPEVMRKRSFTRHLRAARMSGLERRLGAASLTSSSETDLGVVASRDFEFTFRSSARMPRRTLSEHRIHRYHSADANAQLSSGPSAHFPAVQFEPPLSPIPFGLYRSVPNREELTTSSSLVPTLVNASLSDSALVPFSLSESDGDWVSSFPSSHESQQRPSLPEIDTSRGSPSPSPNSTTYRPPEELEAGSSRATASVESQSSSPDDERCEYFKESNVNTEELENGSASAALDEKTTLLLLDSGEEDTEDDNEDGEETDDEPDDEPEGEDDDDDLDVLEGVGWEQGVEPRDDQPGRDGLGAADQAQQNDGELAPQEANDELEGNVEDDMEGAMEAIGMRGPIFGVIQNAALMIFVLDTAIGLGVWVPFTIGKSTALLSLDPYRFLQLLHFPIRAMRIITDPIVDSLLFLITRFVLPFLWGMVRKIINVFVLPVSLIVSGVSRQDKVSDVIKPLVMTYSQLRELVQNQKGVDLTWFNAGPASGTPLPSHLAPIFQPVVNRLELCFVFIGEQCKDAAMRIQATWERMALGQGPSERAFAVALGYIVVGLLLSLYLNILTVGNVKSAGRAIKSAIRQQFLVIKVASFIFIELVTFPLGCGIVLDICTVWLFPEINLATRLAYFMHAPLTATFYHWVAGTMFMYSFAVLLSSCRSIMRPGAMWFVKDPQDQNSHPIRDILDRPTLTQLRKICISGIMYSFVVACVIGSISGLLILGNKSIMPIRWKTRKPLSTIPIDLLFLHQVLPYTMHYFRPKKAVKKVSTHIWGFLASRLRLSSYFFGGRYPEEEHTARDWSSGFLWSAASGDDTTRVRDGTFRRVPNTDHIALPRDMRATAAVHENGEPFDEEARALMTSQDAEAEKAKRQVKTDYIIVYIPPHFRYRIILFILLFWGIAAMSAGFFVGAPLQMGRALFKLFLAEDVHDGYSFVVGFYTLWACYIVGKALDKLDKRRQRRLRVGPRANLLIYALKRALIWVVTISYMTLCFGIIIPTLLSVVIDLYIVLPIRFMVDSHTTPHLRIADMWAFGVLYSNIILHCYRLQPDNRLSAGLQNVISNGWTQPDPIAATKEVIGPVTGGLIGMIIFPAAIFAAMRRMVPGLCGGDKVLFVHVYSGIFVLAGLVRITIILTGLGSKWSQAIRDKEFLVEMRLRNLEPEKQTVDANTAQKETETEYSTDN